MEEEDDDDVLDEVEVEVEDDEVVVGLAVAGLMAITARRSPVEEPAVTVKEVAPAGEITAFESITPTYVAVFLFVALPPLAPGTLPLSAYPSPIIQLLFVMLVTFVVRLVPVPPLLLLASGEGPATPV